MCKCSQKFRCKWFGLAHWFKYNRLRLKWRNLIARLQYQMGLSESYNRYDDFPGPLMTKDEFDHWFGG